MQTLRELIHRLIGVVARRRRDADLEEELRTHLELAAEAAQRRGERPEHAVRAARLRLGSVSQSMESMRDRRGVPWLEDLTRDVRHGLRALRRAPIFTAVAIVTMALGIGANTAILSIVSGVLLRPLHYPQPGQLMHVTTGSGASSGGPLSVAEYLEFQQFNHSFAHVGAFRTGDVNLTAGDRAVRVKATFADHSLLKALGVRLVDGRLFTQDDSIVTAPRLPGSSAVAAPVVLISYALWQSAFGGAPLAGRSIDVDGRLVEVVGVLERGADLMDTHTDVWLPLGFAAGEREARNNHNLTLIGRLRNEATPSSAQTELTTLIETWSARTGITPGPGHAGHVLLPPGIGGEGGHPLRLTPLTDQILGRAGRAIWVLQAAVGLVLLIACANVANLLLGRAETRQREFAVLTALGASRGRLVRKALAESLILSVAGAWLGVFVARIGIDGLVRAYPSSLPRMTEVTVDPQVMAGSLAIAILCGLLFGIAPIMHLRSNATAQTLKSGPRGSSGSPRRHLRHALVITEIALAVMVVVGAGLLLRTVHNLTAVDVGFDRSRLVTFSITLPRASFDSLPRVRAYQRLVEQLRTVPGVEGASAMTGLPLERPVISNQTEMANSSAPMASIAPIDYQRVMTDFFETTGIPIAGGRSFQPADAASEGGVALVNETLANTYWQGTDPIGQRLRPGGTMPWYTVIGVVKDVKQTGVDEPVRAEAYMLVDQVATDKPVNFLGITPTTMNVVVRTALPLSTLAPTIARVVRDLDPRVPVAGLRDMNAVFTDSIRRPRLLAQLLTVFSFLALTLAAIGTYGVLASLVTERRREIGIRLAIGADRWRVLGQIMRQGLRLAAAGLILGLAGSLALNRLLGTLLFGVDPIDPGTMSAVAVMVVGVAALACWLPAWRASRLDASVILRAD
jgi:putative ABC transport system permease protein